MIQVRSTTSTAYASSYWWAKGSAHALALLLAAVLALTVEAGIAHAATFTVANTNDSGPGSLRNAITSANNNNNPTIVDNINFNVPGVTDPGCDAGSGVCTISPESELPAITQVAVVNGYSQSGASANTLAVGNNAQLKVELNGEGAGTDPNGITVSAPNSVVKGLIINRWLGDGVTVTGATGIRIEGNFVGTDASGTSDLGNDDNGVTIDQTSNNVVGGTSPAARNVITGNLVGVSISGASASSNTVQGNYIGTDPSGQTGPGTELFGVSIDDAPNNVVGGTSAGARNVISSHQNNGVFVLGVEASGNRIEGNYIGTDASGGGDLGNSGAGVGIGNAPNNAVGGTSAAARNVISENNAGGVDVDGNSATGNRILRNSIFDNGGIGIDLNFDDVTANDTQDPDTGPNNLQNYPVVTTAVTVGSQTTIQGTLNSVPSKPFAVQLFRSPTSDPSGFGEGETFVGQSNVSTDANGDAFFTLTTNTPLEEGQVVTATATNRATRDTSEFSEAVEVADNTAPTVVATNPQDGAEDVPRGVNVTVTFSEPMDPTTISSDTFRLFRVVEGTDRRIPATVTYNVAERRAILNPSVLLVREATYLAQVTTGARDLTERGLEQREEFTFTVEP